MLHLYFHHVDLIRPEFRIYIELDAQVKDVRLTGMGVPVSERPCCFLPDQQDDLTTTTAYDRVDDRRFPEDV